MAIYRYSILAWNVVLATLLTLECMEVMATGLQLSDGPVRWTVVVLLIGYPLGVSYLKHLKSLLRLLDRNMLVGPLLLVSRCAYLLISPCFPLIRPCNVMS